MSFDITFPNIKMNDFPESLLRDIAEAIIKAHNHRIRDKVQLPDGTALDLNAEATEAKKVSGETPTGRVPKAGRAIRHTPLVYSGRMTDRDAWFVRIIDNEVILTLQGDGLDHAVNVIEIAKKIGKNWDEAWGLGELEQEAVEDALQEWMISNIGDLISITK